MDIENHNFNSNQSSVAGRRGGDHDARVRAGKKAAATRGHDSLSAAGRKGALARTHESRVEGGKKAAAKRGHASLAEAGRKGGLRSHSGSNSQRNRDNNTEQE